MNMVFDFIQTACVLIVLSYLLSRANFFSQVDGAKKLPKEKLPITAAVFVFIALYGIIVRSSLASGMYVDTRIAGIALSGLLFGYLPSALAALPTVLVTLILREQTLLADFLAMCIACGLSGYCHKRFPNFDAALSGIIVGALEVCHMLLIVFFVRPVTAAKAIVYAISFPMIVVNGCAVIAFVLIITDINERRRLWEKESFSRSELSVAKRIQSSLLETNFDLDPRLDLSAFLEPAYDVGGDLYSFTLDGGRYFKFIVGDVSGKGISASIMMSRCETLFREIVLHASDPSETLALLNERLCRSNDAQMFVTAFAGTLDLETGELVYSNAGHVTPYLIEAKKPTSALPRPKGKPLGILPSAKFENAAVELKAGQYVLTYTDGITEAEDSVHTLFGEQRLETALSNLESLSARTVVETLLAAVRSHSAGAQQSDDITILNFALRDAIAERITDAPAIHTEDRGVTA